MTTEELLKQFIIEYPVMSPELRSRYFPFYRLYKNNFSVVFGRYLTGIIYYDLKKTGWSPAPNSELDLDTDDEIIQEMTNGYIDFQVLPSFGQDSGMYERGIWHWHEIMTLMKFSDFYLMWYTILQGQVEINRQGKMYLTSDSYTLFDFPDSKRNTVYGRSLDRASTGFMAEPHIDSIYVQFPDILEKFPELKVLGVEIEETITTNPVLDKMYNILVANEDFGGQFASDLNALQIDLSRFEIEQKQRISDIEIQTKKDIATYIEKEKDKLIERVDDDSRAIDLFRMQALTIVASSS